MGNTAKRRRVREGLSRPGPAARSREEVELESQRQQIASAARERKGRQRDRERERNEETRLLTHDTCEQAVAPSLSVRESSRISLKICVAIVQELRRCPNLAGRRDVMERVLGHTTLSPFLPDCYHRPQDARARDAFILSFKRELQLVKFANSHDLLARKSALLDAAVSSGVRGVGALSKVVGSTKESISIAMRRRVPEADSQGSLPKLRSARQKREGLSTYVKDCVFAWWRSQTKVSPNKKDIVRHRVGRNDWLPPHPTHYLCETQSAFFQQFQDAHPECNVRQRAFERLKPWWVKKLKERNTCCCIYHVEMDMMKVGLSNLRDKLRGFHAVTNCICDCVVCSSDGPGMGCHAHEHVFKHITLLWGACLCPKGEYERWHKLECLMGDCSQCGFHFFKLCPLELLETHSFLLKWKCFEYYQVGVHAETGQPKKRLREAFKETPVHEFLTYMEKTVTTFVTHNFKARWQDEHCQLMMKNIPEGVLVSHIDYAENYTFAIQNEVQSMYYFSTSVTILVHITMWKEGEEIIKQTHYYISDDKTHDSAFVQHCLMLHWDWVVDAGLNIEEHWVFSDGCSSQFKCATAMYFVARYPSLTGGCLMRWNYFESAHGKGEWDGAGAVAKRALRAEQIRNPLRPLQNAEQVVDYLKENYSERVASSYTQSKTKPVSRIFWNIGEFEVDHRDSSVKCRTLPGSKSLYSIMGFSVTDPTLIRTRELSCFCVPCIDGNWNDCENLSHVQEWKVQRLNPFTMGTSASHDLSLDDEANWIHDGVSVDIGDLVSIGDNFMIPAESENEDGVDYYILQCQRSKFRLEESMTCPWGGIFSAGDEVIRAKYYKKYGRGDKTYVFCDKAVDAHVDAHLVRACKFPMLLAAHRVKGSQVYKITTESKRICEDALRDWWAFNAE